jgi:putative endonuclease
LLLSHVAATLAHTSPDSFLPMTRPAESVDRPWFVYLLECADGSYYAGISPDPETRLKQHLRGSGAKYTRARKPLRIIGIEQHADRAAASVAEYQLKQLRKAAKRLWADAHAYRPAPA